MKQCRGCKNNYDQRYADYCFVCNDGDRYEPTDAVLKKRNRKPKVKTNADRIRAMTDEELAMWMAVESWNYPPCTALIDMEDGTKECVQPDCTGCWLDWLKQECES